MALAVIWEQFVNGLIIGSSYALVALGLTLIYGILEVINFAHGELLMVGAFAGLTVMNATGSYALAFLAALAAAAIFSIALERIAIRPVRGGSALLPLITTLGVSIILQNAALLVFGPDPSHFETPYLQTTINIGFSISLQRLLILVVSLLLIGGVYIFIHRTYAGKSLRAVAQDRDAARMMGINSDSVITISFVIGGILVGAAGALIGPLTLVYPTMGVPPVLKAFSTVVLGGFGNVEGALIAAYSLGLVESFATGFLPPQWVDTITFLLLIAVLIVRPTGIIRERLEENV